MCVSILTFLRHNLSLKIRAQNTDSIGVTPPVVMKFGTSQNIGQFWYLQPKKWCRRVRCPSRALNQKAINRKLVIEIKFGVREQIKNQSIVSVACKKVIIMVSLVYTSLGVKTRLHHSTEGKS